MSPEHAVLATYTRNNVLHLFAMPSLIACCFLSNPAMATEDVQRLASRIYPYVAAELFLRWSEAELPEVVARTLEALADLKLLDAGPGHWNWRRPGPDSLAAMQLSLLATPRQMTLTGDLERHLATLLAVLRAVPYSERVTLTELTPAAIIDYGVKLQMITRESHRAGEFVHMSDAHAVLATYYRNNVLHLVAMPSLVACCFIANTELRAADIQRFADRIYPYIAAELFLRWREDEVPAVVNGVLAALGQCGLLEASGDGSWRRPAPSSNAAMELSLLAQSTVQIIERYYLAIALLIRAGSAEITQKALEERCQLMAQRMTLLYGFNSPEFFDRALFGSFINLLRSRGVLRVDEASRLVFDGVLIEVARDAEIVLSEQIRHSILQVTHA
jgi:glycerol-3-phosphate O-acyltransferase